MKLYGSIDKATEQQSNHERNVKQKINSIKIGRKKICSINVDDNRLLNTAPSVNIFIELYSLCGVYGFEISAKKNEIKFQIVGNMQEALETQKQNRMRKYGWRIIILYGIREMKSQIKMHLN